MIHPYAALPDRNFWRTGVADVSPLEWRDIYVRRFPIEPGMRVAAAGSCFAQHIGRRLKGGGFNYQDQEPAPAGLPVQDRHRFGYELYSARFGNVYTARQLLQLYLQAVGQFAPDERVWEQDGRFYDPFRPSIEPGGFASAEEVIALRDKQHLPAVRRMFNRCDVFIFTLGLTEAWVNVDDGSVYPICPGTVAGRFDPERHKFHNFSVSEILTDMTTLIRAMTKRNRDVKFLLTVSPVPLTATATDQHVLTATTYSKSVLRAVAGELYDTFDNVDYFPSFELVTAPSMRGMFFMPNMREVASTGVDHVMRHFFAQHPAPKGAADLAKTAAAERGEPAGHQPAVASLDQADVICDEEKLDLVRA